jgi:hypothetical protein
MNPFDAVRSRLAGLTRGVRKPFWIAGGAVGAALVLALAFLPANAPGASATKSTGTLLPRTSPTASTGSPQPSPVRTAFDDPVVAIGKLLESRAHCFQIRSVTCLADADESGSGLLADDTALIRAIRSGGEIPETAKLAADAPILVQRLGDSALVNVAPDSKPASALLIRGEAGWRIRSFETGTPISPTPRARTAGS